VIKLRSEETASVSVALTSRNRYQDPARDRHWCALRRRTTSLTRQVRVLNFLGRSGNICPSAIATVLVANVKQLMVRCGLTGLRDRVTCVGSPRGVACTENVGFAIPEIPSGRGSFAPDAAYYDGPLPKNLMRFIEGAPTLAVEVRSESNYGDAAIVEMADRRTDDFAAGTQVVWEVDPLAECIHVYKALDPNRPITYHRGEVVEAAVPGWSVAVDWVFS
jgi:hypothetical protein